MGWRAELGYGGCDPQGPNAIAAFIDAGRVVVESDQDAGYLHLIGIVHGSRK